ncbi:diacylglycerol kinase family protein [Neobacillus novalis]|uniref:Diacylglycerol kinase family protein n=1 Tax=Neobacillus novalis TaxID=220687 RepID=A0AA95MJ29_9BACI|nr:diacylglycerol kinase family protein [Neobacillus novalis]WHY84757.1 diacylglycerol kinase family protein [Neobacillus novalis]
MDSQDKRNPIPFISSLSYAISGVNTALRAERNMRIHFISSIIVLLVSFYFSITKIEWLFILLAIGGMFALELVNTAIERVVDLVTEEYHPLAKQAKDLAAGAVLVYAFLSVAMGMIIFSPYVLNLF